jgi:hypothetical protein
VTPARFSTTGAAAARLAAATTAKLWEKIMMMKRDERVGGQRIVQVERSRCWVERSRC